MTKRPTSSKNTLGDAVETAMREHGEPVPSFDDLHAQFAGPETSQQRYGRMIREARHAQGLTQSQLAKLAHIPQPRLVTIEHGNANPTLATMERLARALGATELHLPLPA